MKALRLQVFGLVVVCASGFLMLGDLVGYVSSSVFTWGIFVGVVIALFGLVGDGSPSEGDRAETVDDGSGSGDETAEEESDGDDPGRPDAVDSLRPPT